eukprot:332955_1
MCSEFKSYWNILQFETDFIDVITKCNWNNNNYTFTNLYKTENKYILNLVNKLIDKTNHIIDISNYPEVNSNINTYKMVSYHSEKKALAFWPKQQEGERERGERKRKKYAIIYLILFYFYLYLYFIFITLHAKLHSVIAFSRYYY